MFNWEVRLHADFSLRNLSFSWRADRINAVKLIALYVQSRPLLNVYCVWQKVAWFHRNHAHQYICSKPLWHHHQHRHQQKMAYILWMANTSLIKYTDCDWGAMNKQYQKPIRHSSHFIGNTFSCSCGMHNESSPVYLFVCLDLANPSKLHFKHKILYIWLFMLQVFDTHSSFQSVLENRATIAGIQMSNLIFSFELVPQGQLSHVQKSEQKIN